ncbi:MAG: DnaJ domain-containing protein [Pseudomonadota bacterium]
MFKNNGNSVEVILRMVDGQIIEGSVNGGVTADLAVILNRPGNFVEITVKGGVKKYIGAQHIVSIEKTKSLSEINAPSVLHGSRANAYAILKLPETCTREELNRRYREMVKTYHPDKYRHVDMPDEIAEYLHDTFNALARANDLIEQDLRSRETTAA